MGSASKERLFGATIKVAEAPTRLPARAWNIRMKGYGGPAQPSPLLRNALNAGHRYLEVKCDGCGTQNTVDLTIIRRPKEQRMRCKPCSEQRSYLTSAAIWCGCCAARLRPKTTASLGIPTTSGIGIEWEMRPQGLHANSGSHQSRNNTQIAKPQRAANEQSESQRSTSFTVGAAS